MRRVIGYKDGAKVWEDLGPSEAVVSRGQPLGGSSIALATPTMTVARPTKPAPERGEEGKKK